MKKTKYIFIFSALFSVLLFTTCRKDKGKLVEDSTNPATDVPIIPIVSEPPFPCEDTTCDWKKYPDVPPEDETTGYLGKRSVLGAIYDKQDRNVIYYATREVGRPLGVLWRYNRETKVKTFLDDGLLGNIDINATGWLVYDKVDWNIYKMKTNGDSLTRLTNNGSCKFPKYASDKNFIYYIDDGATTGGVFKMDLNGNKIDTLKNVYSWVYEIKNQIYFVRLATNAVLLIRRDLSNDQETIILSRGGTNDKSGESFWSWYTNADNTILYWQGAHGISKTDLTTLQTTRIIDSKGNSLNQISGFNQSIFTKRFIARQTNTNIVGKYHAEEVRKLVEFTEDGSCMRTVEIPE
jgi:hypothetical protein